MKLGPYLKEIGVTRKSMFTWTDNFRGKQFWKDRNGIRDVELWSLHRTIAKFIYPRLRKYRSINQIGEKHPMGETIESWDLKLGKMERAFRLILVDDWEYSATEEKMIDEGLQLFKDWFLHLWL